MGSDPQKILMGLVWLKCSFFPSRQGDGVKMLNFDHFHAYHGRHRRNSITPHASNWFDWDLLIIIESS